MPTPDPATRLDDAPEHSAGDDGHGDFDALLRQLARPPQVGDQITQELAERVDVPFADAALKAANAARSTTEEPRAGELLGGCYLVCRTLGRGGMGVVLEAKNQRTGKRVAIKWMSSSSKGDLHASSSARFRREARVVAEIDHVNVVNVYDVGERDGTPFLVMELLRGETLRARLRRGPLSWEEARQLMLGIIRGVQAVHRAGVVHRDLKPDNIFLASGEDGPPVTKVLDFGVAAMRRGPDVGSASLTQTGAVLGTPAYMALEQLKGEEVDARADVYALGAMFYEMVTGALPFNARTVADFAVLQATELPVRPSRHLRSLRGPREQLLLRALARRPDDRYPDVGAFALAIEAEGRGDRPRLSRFWVAVLLALLGFAGAALGVRPRPESAAQHEARSSSVALPTAQAPAPQREPVASVGARAESAAVSTLPGSDAGAVVRAGRRSLPSDGRAKVRRELARERAAPPTPRTEDRAIDGFTEIRLDDF
jgi:eukaryotic-like serine/threonine-protein kinase